MIIIIIEKKERERERERMDTRRVTLRGSTPELDKCANRWYPVRTNATNLSMTEDSEAKIHGGVTTAESGIEEIEDRIGIYRTRVTCLSKLPPTPHTSARHRVAEFIRIPDRPEIVTNEILYLRLATMFGVICLSCSLDGLIGGVRVAAGPRRAHNGGRLHRGERAGEWTGTPMEVSRDPGIVHGRPCSTSAREKEASIRIQKIFPSVVRWLVSNGGTSGGAPPGYTRAEGLGEAQPRRSEGPFS